MDIAISDVAAGHTLVDIVVVDPTRRDLVLLDKISSPLQIRSDGRKPTIGIAHLGRASNLCPSLFRHTVHCPIDLIDLWSSVQRYHLESVEDEGP